MSIGTLDTLFDIINIYKTELVSLFSVAIIQILHDDFG
jgi:hypothetical protein